MAGNWAGWLRLLLLIAIALRCSLARVHKKYDTCHCELCNDGRRDIHFSGPRVDGRLLNESLNDRRAFEPVGDAHVRNDTTVHVLISAYRDPRCGQSVFNVFDRAAHPDRMSVGIVDQTAVGKDDFDCVGLYCALAAEARGAVPGDVPCPHLERISVVRVDAAEAKGPIWARAVGAAMVQPHHEFCMQVDAHVDFQHSFDVLLMKMWAMAENEYGVLSTYVGNLGQDLSAKGEVLIGLPRYEIPVICNVIHGGHGTVRNSQATAAQCLTKPVMSLSWAAGWSFAKCHFERNVPNDPFLEGMFDGEEFGRMLRGWTNGYDVYTPHRPVVFHDYRHGLPWQRRREGTWNSNPSNLEVALRRYAVLVEREGAAESAEEAGDMPLGHYGLGTRRSVDQYVKFAGINPREKRSPDLNKRLCHRLEFVAFAEDAALRSTPMPLYPVELPGKLTLDSSKFPVPAISDHQFVDAARSMREILERREPGISHELQMKHFGTPPARLWADLLHQVRVGGKEDGVAGAPIVGSGAALRGGNSEVANSTFPHYSYFWFGALTTLAAFLVLAGRAQRRASPSKIV